MGIKNQLNVVKDNWLIALLLLAVILVPLFSGSGSSSIYRAFAAGSYDAAGYAGEKMMAVSESAAMRNMYPYPSYDENFAPEVKDRKITKTASISNEVLRGTFKEAEEELKAIIVSTDSYLLNENVYKYGVGRKTYYTGSYQIKVEAKKYDSVVSQLKKIGEVQSFSENADDVTGRVTDLQVELAAEKERLKRYQEMYNSAQSVSEKIDLSDRIFNQERTIKYLEDALKNVGNKVEYSTLYVTLSEKQSEYIDVVFVKFSELMRKLINSVNSLLALLFWAIPYAIAVLVIWFVVKKVRKRK